MPTTDMSVALAALVGLCAGLLVGLVPFFVAYRSNRVDWAIGALLATALSGLVVGLLLALPVAVVSTVIVLVGTPPRTATVGATMASIRRKEAMPERRYRRAA